MKSFVIDFFQTYDSHLVEEGPTLIVDLSPELKDLFGRPSLRLVFDPQDVDESSDLVTHGGYVLNTIHEFLETRGVKVVSRLSEKPQPANEELMAQIGVAGGRVRQIGCELVRTVDVLFNFKCTYLSDEKAEALYRLGVDARGVVFDAADYYSEDVLRSELVAQSQKGSIDLSRGELEGRFKECLKSASERAQDHAQMLQADILKRLHRNITRIQGYYGAQIDELHRNQPSYEEKRVLLQREYEHKLREEVDNHKLRIILKLVNYQIVERREIEIQAEIASPAGKIIVMPLIYDLHTGQLDYGICPSCQTPMESVVVTDAATLACPACVAACQTCGRRFSRTGELRECAVGHEPVCTDCALTCSQCGQCICTDHVRTCAVGREILCTACAKACTVCGQALCADHTFECAATKDLVCFEHRAICPRCRNVYSSAYTARTHQCPHCSAELR